MTCKMVIVPLVAGLLVGSADLLVGSPDKTTYTYIYIDDTNCIPNPPPNGTQCGSIHQARLDNTVTYTYTGRKYRDVGEIGATGTVEGVGPYDQKMSVSISLVLPFELPANFSGYVIPVHSVITDGIQTVTDPVNIFFGIPGLARSFVYPGPSMPSCAGHFALHTTLGATSVHNSAQPSVPYNSSQPPCLGAYFETDKNGHITTWNVSVGIRYSDDDVFPDHIMSANCQNDPSCSFLGNVIDIGQFSPQPYGGPFSRDRIFGEVVGDPGKWKVQKDGHLVLRRDY